MNLLPIPQQGDLQSWAESLVSALEGELGKIGSVSGPVYDTSGRVILDQNGMYAYAADGSMPIAPDIVEIDTEHLIDAAVATAKLDSLAVNSDKIADLAVAAAKLADSAVTTTKIANAAVGNAAIANAAVGTAQIANAAIVSALIGDLEVVTAKIDDAAINDAKIANAAIGTAHIQDAAITNAKIDSLDVGKLISGTIYSESITLGSGGALRSGQSDYNTGVGFWLGSVSGTPRFSIGDPNGDHFLWTGSGISFTGDFLLDSNNYWKTSDGTFRVGTSADSYINYDPSAGITLGPKTELAGADAFYNRAVYFHTHFESIDGWWDTSGNAIVALNYSAGAFISIAGGEDATGWGKLRFSRLVFFEFDWISSTRKFEARVEWSAGFDPNRETYIGMGDPEGADAQFRGFKEVDAALYGCVVVDGVEYLTDLSYTVTSPQWYRLRVEVVKSGSVYVSKFYVDDVLQGTDGTDYYLYTRTGFEGTIATFLVKNLTTVYTGQGLYIQECKALLDEG